MNLPGGLSPAAPGSGCQSADPGQSTKLRSLRCPSESNAYPSHMLVRFTCLSESQAMGRRGTRALITVTVTTAAARPRPRSGFVRAGLLRPAPASQCSSQCHGDYDPAWVAGAGGPSPPAVTVTVAAPAPAGPAPAAGRGPAG